jgi:uncharacterized membrane protein
MKIWKLFVFLMILIAIFIAGCTSTAQTPTGNVVCDVKKGCDTDDYVRIPISEISSNMKKYSYDAEGIKVNYFVVKGKDGEIRTAFDACDVCGGYKGYRQQGDDVICNNCGRYFSIQDIGTKNRGGGCWPSYLSNKIEGDNILVKKSEIAEGAFRFR